MINLWNYSVEAVFPLKLSTSQQLAHTKYLKMWVETMIFFVHGL